MYLVDTPVWIDFLRGRKVAHVAALTELLQGEETVGIAPIILQEILQGADSDRRLDPRSSNDCLIGMIAVEHDLVLE